MFWDEDILLYLALEYKKKGRQNDDLFTAFYGVLLKNTIFPYTIPSLPVEARRKERHPPVLSSPAKAAAAAFLQEAVVFPAMRILATLPDIAGVN